MRLEGLVRQNFVAVGAVPLAYLDFLSALGELTSTLNNKRLEKTERRIQSMEEKVESSLSSASDSHSKSVRKVPVIVRVSAVISCGSD